MGKTGKGAEVFKVNKVHETYFECLLSGIGKLVY